MPHGLLVPERALVVCKCPSSLVQAMPARLVAWFLRTTLSTWKLITETIYESILVVFLLNIKFPTEVPPI
jgi:hypothetical protein